MAFLSKQTILSAYRSLSKLTNDPSAQGATQVTSALRYLFALDAFKKKYSRDCDTRNKNDKDEFIRLVGNVVSIGNNLYTANFFNSIKESADFSVGSNFFSVNTVKNSLENENKEYSFPKRGNTPLFKIINGKLSERIELLPNIDSFLSTTELKSAFALWLIRDKNIDETNPYDAIYNSLSEDYSNELISKLLSSSKNQFSDFSISFSDTKTELDIADFVQTNPDKTTSKTPINKEDISKELKISFLKYFDNYLRLSTGKSPEQNKLDQYISLYEKNIEIPLRNLVPDFNSIFDYENVVKLNNVFQRAANIDDKFKLLLLDAWPKDKVMQTLYYEPWTMVRHYRNFLELIANVSHLFNSIDTDTNVISVFDRKQIDGIRYNEYLTAMRTKPFLLLAGISGTGKSRIVKQMAFESCPDIPVLRCDKTAPGNYELIEVKPNWHDSTELLGYESEIGGAHFVLTPFIKFLVKAMRYEDKAPFFVCMDEMNLAPVEQYFAEFLSVLESRKLLPNGIITSEPLVKADIFIKYGATLKDELFDIKQPKAKGDKTEDPVEGYGDFNAVYERLKADGLRLPSNLIVVGTVNMDETTHQFSRKVIDRAMTIEMNIEDAETPFKNFFDGTAALDYPNDEPADKNLFLPKIVQASEALSQLSDEDATYLKDSVPQLLHTLNTALNGTPFKIAYRVQNELILYFYSLREEKPDDTAEALLATAIDAILMMKVLPRIEGDEDLLEEPLKELAVFTKSYPNSAKKIAEMQERLSRAHFTSFWP